MDEVVWRVAREGRDPTDCGASGGRWDDTTFDVLYTSRTREGALAEMLFHLRAGQPVVPSKLRFGLHELRIRLRNVLDLSSLHALEALGLDTRQYGRMSYLERTAEYPRTQEIAEVAHFHGHDGLLVPSARSNAVNLIVFCERVDSDQVEAIRDHGIVDWNSLP
ncbi:RES family NAD+ phosphorylase [Mesorhizobium sp. LHD-90]|uniref:RES family NAD+ phosphorylase n=1 Tax=Mesorhizobium sp. LHD-90 TaxID=3071414 RepID=UPI0027E1CD6E|nr:RES family NAD+ phosphorylase [Mesorhizobium sp. LHD-90]MDQ6433741.1 RES family NAD+ phosphorylase [Mesorhizobium sp. LHD-90]